MIALYCIATFLSGIIASAAIPWGDDGMELLVGVALLLLLADGGTIAFFVHARGWAP